MFCNECGAKLSDEAQFCTNCGARVVNKKIEVQKPEQTYSAPQPEQAQVPYGQQPYPEQPYYAQQPADPYYAQQPYPAQPSYPEQLPYPTQPSYDATAGVKPKNKWLLPVILGVTVIGLAVGGAFIIKNLPEDNAIYQLIYGERTDRDNDDEDETKKPKPSETSGSTDISGTEATEPSGEVTPDTRPADPTNPAVPIANPTDPAVKPSETATERPTTAPTEKPTEGPTERPTAAPTEAPTEPDTEAPMVPFYVGRWLGDMGTVIVLRENFTCFYQEPDSSNAALASGIETSFRIVDDKIDWPNVNGYHLYAPIINDETFVVYSDTQGWIAETFRRVYDAATLPNGTYGFAFSNYEFRSDFTLTQYYDGRAWIYLTTSSMSMENVAMWVVYDSEDHEYDEIYVMGSIPLAPNCDFQLAEGENMTTRPLWYLLDIPQDRLCFNFFIVENRQVTHVGLAP